MTIQVSWTVSDWDVLHWCLNMDSAQLVGVCQIYNRYSWWAPLNRCWGKLMPRHPDQWADLDTGATGFLVRSNIITPSNLVALCIRWPRQMIPKCWLATGQQWSGPWFCLPCWHGKPRLLSGKNFQDIKKAVLDWMDFSLRSNVASSGTPRWDLISIIGTGSLNE